MTFALRCFTKLKKMSYVIKVIPEQSVPYSSLMSLQGYELYTQEDGSIKTKLLKFRNIKKIPLLDLATKQERSMPPENYM